MANVKKLDWDTAFFGFPVYRLDLTPERIALLDCLDGNVEHGLCYIFASPETSRMASVNLLSIGAVHYGSRVLFKADVDGQDPFVPNVVVVANPMDDELYALAVASGRYSRFARDPRLSCEFVRLYRQWVDNCLAARDIGRGEVFAIKDGGVWAGMIALSSDSVAAKVELLAVGEKFRRRGVGRKLLQTAFAYAAKRGCVSIYVATQGENVPACGLYNACGFRLIERSEIWHLPI